MSFDLDWFVNRIFHTELFHNELVVAIKDAIRELEDESEYEIKWLSFNEPSPGKGWKAVTCDSADSTVMWRRRKPA